VSRRVSTAKARVKKEEVTRSKSPQVMIAAVALTAIKPVVKSPKKQAVRVRPLPLNSTIKSTRSSIFSESSPKKGVMSLRSNPSLLEEINPCSDAAYFNIVVERRHADRLEKKDIDEESKLEVTYRILKD